MPMPYGLSLAQNLISSNKKYNTIDDCRSGTLYFMLQIKAAIKGILKGGPMEEGGVEKEVRSTVERRVVGQVEGDFNSFR